MFVFELFGVGCAVMEVELGFVVVTVGGVLGGGKGVQLAASVPSERLGFCAPLCKIWISSFLNETVGQMHTHVRTRTHYMCTRACNSHK